MRPKQVECIGKGKARTRYEFGCKTSIATTNERCKGGRFVLGAMALPGNPYDGHSLAGHAVKRAYVPLVECYALNCRARSPRLSYRSLRW